MAKIDPKSIGVDRVSSVDRVKTRRVESDVSRGSASAATDRVAISEELESLVEVAAESPVGDLEFAELKEAIRSGEYQPDLEGLASRMLSDSNVLGDLIDE